MTTAVPYPQGNLVVACRPPKGTRWTFAQNDGFDCHSEADRQAALLWATQTAVAAFFGE